MRPGVFGYALVALLCTTLIANGATALKGPYLMYPGEPDRMRVFVQADAEPSSCSITWGTTTAYANGPSALGVLGANHVYTAELTGLSHDTRYYYKIDLDGAAHEGSFMTAPPPATSATSFYAVGDTRTNPADMDLVAQQMLDDMDTDASVRQTLWIHSGDWVSDGDAETDWTNQFFNRSYPASLELMGRLPVMGCRGNHEQSGGLYGKYFPYSQSVVSGVTPSPSASDFYYSFDYGPVHFAVIDDNVDVSASSAQFAWLSVDLQNSTKPWTVLLFHAPAYSAGVGHGDDADNQVLMSDLAALSGVEIDVVISGHNHYYARCEKYGVIYLTAGGGGAPYYAPDLLYSSYVVTGAGELSFVRIDVSGGQLTGVATSAAGAVLDTFSIEKVLPPGPTRDDDSDSACGGSVEGASAQWWPFALLLAMLHYGGFRGKHQCVE